MRSHSHPPHYNSMASTVLRVVSILISLSLSLPAAGLQLFWNDPPTELPFEPTFVGTTIMVPVTLVEYLGGRVSEDGAHLIAQMGMSELRLTVGDDTAYADGLSITLPVAPEQRSGVLWVPLRTLADHLLGARIVFAAGSLQLVPWQPLAGLAVGAVGGSKPISDPPTPSPPEERSEGVTAPESVKPLESSGEGYPEAREQKTDEPSSAVVGRSEAPVGKGVPPEGATHIIDPPIQGASPPGEASDRVYSQRLLTDMVTALPSSSTLIEFRTLEAIVKPRLRVTLDGPKPSAGRDLPPIKPTALRAERLHWVEASVSRGETGKETLDIKASKAFTHNAFLLTEPARLVIDLTGLDTGHAPEPLNVYGPNVQRVRMSQNAPDVVRVVIDLLDTAGYTVTPSEDGRQLTVELHHVLRSIDVQFDVYSGTVRLDIPSSAEYEVLRLKEPERLVIDLIDTTWIPAELPVLPDNAPIRNWRIQQFDPSHTRMVFEIDRHLDIAPVSQADTLAFHVGHQVKRVGFATLADIGLVLHVDGAKLPEPHTMYLPDPDRLVIDLPGTVLSQPLQDTMISGDLGWRIRSGQHPEMVRLVLDLNSSVEYAVIRMPLDQGIAVIVLPPSLKGRTIFLDPGHGGHDPGTMGRVLGLMEKDVVLDVALRLRELLQKAGASVHLSRSDDRFVELTRRPALARDVGADTFVSIHVNASADNFEAGGTETYIHSTLNHREDARLATAVHRHVLSAAGLANRGVRTANFAVLRQTYMPSILVELAFLSKAEEEFLLAEEAFRQQLAQGLFNGLVAFFNEGASRAADLSADQRLRFEQGIVEALVNDGFTYLLQKSESASSALVGAVRVQPF